MQINEGLTPCRIPDGRDRTPLAHPGSSENHLQKLQTSFWLDSWGLGTFDVVYPAYRSFYTTLYVNAAHNDYLQVLIETGIVGFGCVVWFGSVLYRTGLKGLGHWNQSWRGALQLSALVGCTGLLVHSAFDFNLQVPANAAIFYSFCALATSVRSNAGPSTSSLGDVPLKKVS